MPTQPFRKDLEDAIEHADSYGGSGWKVDDFSLKFLGNLTAKQIGKYDDLSSWVDLDPRDFEGLSTQEKILQLADFRGVEWARIAAGWLKTGIPPIVVIEYPDPENGELQQVIGDGRGRVNFAIALGRKIPTWKMTYKGIGENLGSMTPEQLYDGERPSSNEMIWDHLNHSEWTQPFRIVEIDPVEVYTKWMMQGGKVTIKDGYKLYAGKPQRDLVKAYRKDPLLRRSIVVIDGKELLDGFHRITALAMNKVHKVQALDLSQAVED